MIIYHIIDESEKVDIKQSHYSPKSLESDTFIHCSLKHQVAKVANNLFKDEACIYLLVIDSNKLEHPEKLVLEDLYNLNEDYPHYYAPLNTSAIIDTIELLKTNEEFIF